MWVSTGHYCKYDATTEDGVCTFHDNLRREIQVPLKFAPPEKQEGHCMVFSRDLTYCKNPLSKEYNYICTTHVNAARKGNLLLFDSPDMPIPEERLYSKTPCRAIAKDTKQNCLKNIEDNGICKFHNGRISKGEKVTLSDNVKDIQILGCKVFIPKSKRFCEWDAKYDGMCCAHNALYHQGMNLLFFPAYLVDVEKLLKNPVRPPRLIISKIEDQVKLSNVIEDRLFCCVLKRNNKNCEEKVTHLDKRLCTKHFNKAVKGEILKISVPDGYVFDTCRVTTRNKTYCINPISIEEPQHFLCNRHLNKFKQGSILSLGILTTFDFGQKKDFGICIVMKKIDQRCSEVACENRICKDHNKSIENGFRQITVDDLPNILISKHPHEMCKAIKQKDRENCINSPVDEGLCTFHLNRMRNGEKVETREIPLTTKRIVGNLFVENFPELAKEWNHSKNIGIDINTITYGCSTVIDWICPIKYHEYQASMNSRTADGTGCLLCFQEVNRTIDKNILENFIEGSYITDTEQNKTHSTITGDDTEIYVTELLLNSDKYKIVERIGHVGSDSDISVTMFDNTIHQIQVKTLTYDAENIYHVVLKDYPDDMLLVLVNKERTRFACIFMRETDNVDCLKLTFDYQFSKFKNKLFKNKEDFLSYLHTKIPYSTSLTVASKSVMDEMESLKRLELYCKERGINFQRNSTNSNSVDLFLNGFRTQAKYVSLHTAESINYKVGNVKSAGRLTDNGITYQIKRPYHEDDMDVFVVNVGGTIESPQKYQNNFMFLPKNILKERGKLKTDECEGKPSFQVCPPDYSKSHWSKEFWDNISILQK